MEKKMCQNWMRRCNGYSTRDYPKAIRERSLIPTLLKKLGHKAIGDAWAQSYPSPSKMQLWYMEIPEEISKLNPKYTKYLLITKNMEICIYQYKDLECSEI